MSITLCSRRALRAHICIMVAGAHVRPTDLVQPGVVGGYASAAYRTGKAT